MKLFLAIGLVAATSAISGNPAAGQNDPMDRASIGGILVAQAVQSGTGEGEVRRIDKEAKKVTLRHGPIVGFDMSAMTMVFVVKTAQMLETLKVGDKVRFTVVRENGAMILESLEPAP